MVPRHPPQQRLLWRPKHTLRHDVLRHLPKTNSQKQSRKDRPLGIHRRLVRDHDTNPGARHRLDPNGLYYATKLSRWAECVSQRCICDPGQIPVVCTNWIMESLLAKPVLADCITRGDDSHVSKVWGCHVVHAQCGRITVPARCRHSVTLVDRCVWSVHRWPWYCRPH